MPPVSLRERRGAETRRLSMRPSNPNRRPSEGWDPRGVKGAAAMSAPVTSARALHPPGPQPYSPAFVAAKPGVFVRTGAGSASLLSIFAVEYRRRRTK